MLKVISSGVLSSIQDQGRFGFRHYGVPVAGVMDKTSANLANLLLNNSFSDALMEITLTGPNLEFAAPTRIAICGADMSACLNGSILHLNTAIEIETGDTLNFGRLNYGARTYIAVQGGFQTDVEMASRSFFKGVSDEFRIEKGDLLNYSVLKNINHESHTTVKVDKGHFSVKALAVSEGPEFALLTETQTKKLFSTEFSISKDNDRMAYQLEEPLENDLQPILTSAVLPGTVQLTPAGKLIVLMRDCQTTGGYPRILQLSEAAVNQLSQKKQGDVIQFESWI